MTEIPLDITPISRKFKEFPECDQIVELCNTVRSHLNDPTHATSEINGETEGEFLPRVDLLGIRKYYGDAEPKSRYESSKGYKCYVYLVPEEHKNTIWSMSPKEFHCREYHQALIELDSGILVKVFGAFWHQEDGEA